VTVLGAVPWMVARLHPEHLVPQSVLLSVVRAWGVPIIGTHTGFLRPRPVLMAVLLLAWARDLESATFDKQRAWEAAKGTALVLGYWLLWLAKSGKLSSAQIVRPQSRALSHNGAERWRITCVETTSRTAAPTAALKARLSLVFRR
jgi:hypothetical protein